MGDDRKIKTEKFKFISRSNRVLFYYVSTLLFRKGV